MEEQFVPYNLSLKLKEIGFDERCLAGYYNDGKSLWFFRFHKNSEREPTVAERFATAPLWEQAFDWFRNEHKLHVMFETVLMSYGLVDCRNNDMKIVRFISAEDRFLNKSELKTEALKELIELVETKKDSV